MNDDLKKIVDALLKGKQTNLKGEPGKDGNDGKTPIKGVDYFTPSEISDFLERATPIKGVDYFDGRDGRNGKDGIGINGKDGRDGKDGSPDTPEDIVAKINTLKGVIDAETIKGLPELFKPLSERIDKVSNYLPRKGYLDQRWHGGGASSFLQLSDTPKTYVGQAGKVATVDPTETGLIFTDVDVTGFVPYVGATQDVDLGNYTLRTPGIVDFGTPANFALDVANSKLNDTSGVVSLNYTFRYLYDGNGDIIIDYSTAGNVDITGTLNGITIPTGPGTFALISDLSGYVPYTGAVDDLDLGTHKILAGGDSYFYTTTSNVAARFRAVDDSQGIYIGNAQAFSTDESGIYEAGGDAPLVVFDRDNQELHSGNFVTPYSGGYAFVWGGVGSKKAHFDTVTSLTADRTFIFPDANGTFALTSDLGSYVPYTGATSDVNLGTHNLSVYYAVLSNDSTIKMENTDGLYFDITTGNGLTMKIGGGYVVSFDDTSLTDNRGYTLPNASGTLALTSDLTNYFYKPGISGGQTAIGGTGVSDALTLQGTSGNGTSTTAAINFKVGNNGATTAGYIRNDGLWLLGATAPTNLGLVNVNAGTSTVPALTVNMTPSGSADMLQIWRANLQKVVYINQYGELRMGQTNSTGQLTVDANGAFGQVISFTNSNTNASAGTILQVGTSGGGGAVLRYAAGGVGYDVGGQTTYSAVKAFYSLAGQTGIGSRNDFFSISSTGANAYKPDADSVGTYSAPNSFSVGGRNIGPDSINAQNGNISVMNPQSWGGGVGAEVLNTTIAGPQWTAANGMSISAGTAIYAYNASGGTLTQTSSNFTEAIKPDSWYELTLVITGTSGTHYLYLYDPAGTNGTPASIQSANTSMQRIGMIGGRVVANGTTKFYFKSEATAASLSGVSFVLKALSTTTSGGFTITTIGLKEAKGGDFVAPGLFRGQGSSISSNGLKVSGTGSVKINASENDVPSAWLQLPAGTTAALTAPLKFTSGTSMTTAEAGAMEFTTDDLYFTITTGAARKGVILNDGANLTSGKYPIASTNGRLIDGPAPLSGTKTYYVSDTNGGPTDRKLTFTNGILTSET